MASLTNFILLLAVAVFTGISALPYESDGKGGDNYNLVYPANLPNETLTFDHIEALMKALAKLEDTCLFDGTDVGRWKRQIGKDNSNWCCRVDPPTDVITDTRPVVRSHVVYKPVERTTERGCGLFGLRTCTNTQVVTIPVVEYFWGTEVYEIPAREWVNGCPDRHVGCCAGYFRIETENSPIKNCLTGAQFLETVEVLKAWAALGLLDL